MTGKKSMVLYWASLAVVVLANVLYHIVQKKTPSAANPALTLAVTYLVAAALCLAAFLLIPGRGSFLQELRQLDWTALVLGVAIIGLEVGFLLAYRAGWNVSLAAMVANIAVGLLMVPIGLILFREQLKPVNVLGILLCIAGLVCMTRK